MLVSNARLSHLQPLEDITAAQLDEMLAVNLRAPFLLAQCAAGSMRERGSGRILLISRVARHHCYEVHIGFTHLGWNVWTRNQAALAATARRLAEVLERGPLPLPGG